MTDNLYKNAKMFIKDTNSREVFELPILTEVPALNVDEDFCYDYIGTKPLTASGEVIFETKLDLLQYKLLYERLTKNRRRRIKSLKRKIKRLKGKSEEDWYENINGKRVFRN